jgi:hypothetical protein
MFFTILWRIFYAAVIGYTIAWMLEKAEVKISAIRHKRRLKKLVRKSAKNHIVLVR